MKEREASIDEGGVVQPEAEPTTQRKPGRAYLTPVLKRFGKIEPSLLGSPPPPPEGAPPGTYPPKRG